MKVYLLWTHDEHGPEDLRATLCHGHLQEMLKHYYPAPPGLEDLPRRRMKEASVKLHEALSEETEGTWKLEGGWGGLHLQVKELELIA